MVIGKTARTKQWVSGQQIDSFSDLENGGGSDSDEDSAGSLQNGAKDAEDEDGAVDPTKDWEAFEELARKSTSTSKTSIRTEFLKGPLLRSITKEGSQSSPMLPSTVALIFDCSLDPPAIIVHPANIDVHLPEVH